MFSIPHDVSYLCCRSPLAPYLSVTQLNSLISYDWLHLAYFKEALYNTTNYWLSRYKYIENI